MKTLWERIIEKAVRNEDSGCLEWMGARAGVGYGYFTIRKPEKKNIYVHRAVYSAFFGDIPEGMVIMHSCDNPACCEIKHLSLGTKSDNALDMVAKDRHPPQMRPGFVHGKRLITILREQARNSPCVRCGREGETRVCHMNGYRASSYGKGRGIKCHDLATAFFCQACDDLFSEKNYHLWPGGSKSVDRSEQFLHWIMMTRIRSQC